MPSTPEASENESEARRLARVLRDATAGAAEERAKRASARLAQRAEEAGLVDVLYATTDSPLGTLLVAVSRHGVVRIAYPEEEDVLQDLSDTVSPRILHSTRATQAVRRELEEYFAGRR